MQKNHSWHTHESTLLCEVIADLQKQVEASNAFCDAQENARIDAERNYADLQSKQGWATDEDLADFANMLSMEDDGTKYEGNTMHRLIQQYKAEKGIV